MRVEDKREEKESSPLLITEPSGRACPPSLLHVYSTVIHVSSPVRSICVHTRIMVVPDSTIPFDPVTVTSPKFK